MVNHRTKRTFFSHSYVKSLEGSHNSSSIWSPRSEFRTETFRHCCIVVCCIRPTREHFAEVLLGLSENGVFPDVCGTPNIWQVNRNNDDQPLKFWGIPLRYLIFRPSHVHFSNISLRPSRRVQVPGWVQANWRHLPPSCVQSLHVAAWSDPMLRNQGEAGPGVETSSYRSRGSWAGRCGPVGSCSKGSERTFWATPVRNMHLLPW